ncbi:MAG: hypothetical protein ACJAUQ_001118 [Maribacter sp.]|jgi:hypothetical protein
MKTLVYISGALSFICTVLGILFKTMYWEFGPLTSGLFFVIGLGVLSLIFTPVFAKYLYDRTA